LSGYNRLYKLIHGLDTGQSIGHIWKQTWAELEKSRTRVMQKIFACVYYFFLFCT